MDIFNQNTTSSKKSQGSSQQNSFARALAEMERSRGGHMSDENLAADGTDVSEPQAKDLEEQAKKQRLRKEMHAKVNPAEQSAVFDAREKQVKRELEQIRAALKKRVEKRRRPSNRPIDIAVEKRVVNPGQQGTYDKGFLDHIKSGLSLLLQQAKSADVWRQRAEARKAKQRRKRGLNFEGNAGKATHEMLNPERFNAYSGA